MGTWFTDRTMRRHGVGTSFSGNTVDRRKNPTRSWRRITKLMFEAMQDAYIQCAFLGRLARGAHPSGHTPGWPNRNRILGQRLKWREIEAIPAKLASEAKRKTMVRKS